MNIAAEILASRGTPNTFSYYTMSGGNSQPGQFVRLEPLPHGVLRPAANGNYSYGANHPAAAEFRIRLPVTGDVTELDASEVRVIWDYKPGEDNKKIQLNWRLDANVITVNVLIPTDLTILEQQFQFPIVINPTWNNNLINSTGTPQLLSHRYFDLNGNVLTAQFTPKVVVMN